ncbi:MAG: ATP-binding protein [Tepidisphaeraceae bacterium]|jgi:two-component system phosphate regulon sensor histidine kinase PhoR
MRLGVILCILTPVLLAAGVVSFAGVASRAGWQTYPPRPEVVMGVLLLCSAASALLWVAALHRNCRVFSDSIKRMCDSGKLTPVDCPSGLLRPVTRSINTFVETAAQTLDEAARRAKELEIQLKVVIAERQDAQAILHSISDAVLVTDPFDELVLANESAEKVFHFDAERACGAPMGKALKDPKVLEMIRDMRQSRSLSGRRVVEHTVRGSDDGEEWEKTFKITLSCVADQVDGSAGVVVVLHDMTREKEVARMKNDFVSNVSHELRTPLASIKAYVEMLIDGEAEDEKTTREFYEVIQGESNRLSRLIDNILSISRIESGLVQINKMPQSLTVILKEAIEVITPQARTKQIKLVEKLTPVFYQTMADKDMLYQAVLNLLSNAVKYTPDAGTITIETLVDEAARKVTTRITDSGVGIPPKDLPHVFDKFFRSEANKHMAKGTGLGLALVKHIVENVHKGRIFVESEVGKGSCFGFELELAK